MKKTISILSLVVSANVYCENLDDVYPHFFMGAKGEYFIPNSDFVDKSTGVGANIGVSLTEHWSWDVGYQYMGDISKVDNAIDASMFESAVRYDWYPLKNTSIYAKLGAAYWMLDGGDLNDLSDSGFSPLGELGVNHRLTPNIYLNLGYKVIADIGGGFVNEYDAHAVSAGIAYHFKGKKEAPIIKDNTDVLEPTRIVEAPKEDIEIPMKKVYETAVNEVNFEFNSSKLSVSSELQNQFDEFKRVAAMHPHAKLEIVGHTDSIGSEEYNMQLSQKRAQAVVDALQLSSDELQRVVVSGKGESEPLASNMTAYGRQLNRRVELIVWQFEYE